jgi:hypothetical protein
MICKYCGENRKLVKAHIIPAAFFRRQRRGKDSPRIFVEKRSEHPKRVPAGIYDGRILCERCGPQFGDWDNYAVEILREPPDNASPIMHGNRLVGYEINDYNYGLLKLFFVSMLWRASVSVHPFYERISLGPYETEAKRLLERRDPGPLTAFSVTLARFDHALGGTIFDPHTDRFGGVNYCRFYLGGYVAYIKTDKRKTPEPHLYFSIKPDKPLRIIGRNLENSYEMRLIKEIVAANKRG